MTNRKVTNSDYCENVCWSQACGFYSFNRDRRRSGRPELRDPMATCKLFRYTGTWNELRGTYQKCEDVMRAGKCPKYECVPWAIKAFIKEKPQG